LIVIVVLSDPEPRVVFAGEQENRLTVNAIVCGSFRPLRPGLNDARPDCVVGGGPEHFWGRTAAPTGGVVPNTQARAATNTNPRVARIVVLSTPLGLQFVRAPARTG
jgi:hypothetical protein